MKNISITKVSRSICDVFDSEFTHRGTKRKLIYIGSCGLGLTREAKSQAIKDFNEYKKTIPKKETVKPLKRKLPAFPEGQTKEILLERMEISDAIEQGYKLEKYWEKKEFLSPVKYRHDRYGNQFHWTRTSNLT